MSSQEHRGVVSAEKAIFDVGPSAVDSASNPSPLRPDVSLPDNSHPDAPSSGISSRHVSSPDVSHEQAASMDAPSPDITPRDVTPPDVSPQDVSDPHVPCPDVANPCVKPQEVVCPDISHLFSPSDDVLPSPDVPAPNAPSQENLSPENLSPEISPPDIPSSDIPVTDCQGSADTLSPTISSIQVPHSDSLEVHEMAIAVSTPVVQTRDQRATKTPTPTPVSVRSSDPPTRSESPDPLSREQNIARVPKSYTLRDLQQKIQYQPPTPRPSQKAAKAHVGPPHSPPAIHTQLAKRKLKDSMRAGPDTPLKTVKACSPSPSKVRSRPISAGKYPTPLKGMSENIPSPRKRARKSKVSTPPPGLRHELELVRMPGPDPEQDELAGNGLLLDQASRKANLIAFGARGPLNQGRWSKSPKNGDRKEDDIENEGVEHR